MKRNFMSGAGEDFAASFNSTLQYYKEAINTAQKQHANAIADRGAQEFRFKIARDKLSNAIQEVGTEITRNNQPNSFLYRAWQSWSPYTTHFNDKANYTAILPENVGVWWITGTTNASPSTEDLDYWNRKMTTRFLPLMKEASDANYAVNYAEADSATFEQRVVYIKNELSAFLQQANTYKELLSFIPTVDEVLSDVKNMDVVHPVAEVAEIKSVQELAPIPQAESPGANKKVLYGAAAAALLGILLLKR